MADFLCTARFLPRRTFAEPTPLDDVHLAVHEAGHLLFSYLGDKPQLWGETIFQLLVPELLCSSFGWRGQIPGTTFCAFGIFHSCLRVATYMSDALVRQIRLVTVGGIADGSDHDWFRIFTHLGVMPHAPQNQCSYAVVRLVWHAGQRRMVLPAIPH